MLATRDNIIYWLGAIHGHWDIDPRMDSISEDVHSLTINMGIAIVVPTDKILEVINQPLFANAREQHIASVKSKRPKTDSNVIDLEDSTETEE